MCQTISGGSGISATPRQKKNKKIKNYDIEVFVSAAFWQSVCDRDHMQQEALKHDYKIINIDNY